MACLGTSSHVGILVSFSSRVPRSSLGSVTRRCSGAEIAELHLRAGVWLAENDHLEEAVSHLLAGGESEEAEKISSRIGETTPLRLSEGVNPTHLSTSLTDREEEILQQLVKGKTNKEIGEYLFISTDTVKSHLKNIYQILEVKSRLQAVAKASKLEFTVETLQP